MVDSHGLPWLNTILRVGACLQDVVRNLEDSGLQICLLVDEDGCLVGTITDGDVRRGLLRGLGMQSPAEAVVHRTAFVVPPQMGHDMVSHLMRVNRLRQIPVVDAEGRVVGLHVWSEFVPSTERANLMVIMAGGKGRRLHPLTETCPKPLLPVQGKPILEHIIERAVSEGFRRFVLTVHHLADMIEGYFGDGRRWNVEIEYIREKGALGTAGALSLLRPLPGQPIIVSNADVITDIRYGELLDFHALHSAEATMAVRLHEWEHPFGVVRTEGLDIIGFEEKPVARMHVNAGVYALNPSALDVIIHGERCDMPAVFERIAANGGRTVAYPVHERWLDVGRMSEYENAQKVNVEEATVS